MCIIMLSKTGDKIPEEHIITSQKSNEDGYGMMWTSTKTDRVEIFKTMDFQEFLKKYDELYDAGERPVLHLRYSTAGNIDLTNCHPFEMCDGKYALMHNGTIKELSDIKSTKSDSLALAELMTEDFLELLFNGDRAAQKLMVNLTNPSRVLIMRHDGRCYRSGNWELVEDKFLYSADYWKKERWAKCYGYWSTYGWYRHANTPKPKGEVPKAPVGIPNKRVRWDATAGAYVVSVFKGECGHDEWTVYQYDSNLKGWYAENAFGGMDKTRPFPANKKKKKQAETKTTVPCDFCEKPSNVTLYAPEYGVVGGLCDKCLEELRLEGVANLYGPTVEVRNLVPIN